MKFYFTALCLCISFCVSAQSNYHKGSVVDSNGREQAGYINYREWEKNPKYIEFKVNQDDKDIIKLNPTSIKSFTIDGLEKYYTYTGTVSLNKTHFPDLSERPDTTTRFGKYFLQLTTTGDNLTLFSYTDSLKTRYFIQEKNGQPVELIYQEYYAESRATTIKYTGYIDQLTDIVIKYKPQDNKISRKIEGLKYDGDDIAEVVNAINGVDNKTIKKSTAQSYRLFIGAALNVTQTGFEGDNDLSNAPKAITYTPKISFGIDIFNNPNVQRFIFRTTLSLSYISPQLQYTSQEYFGLNSTRTYEFTQFTTSLTPQLILNIYNKDFFKFYIGAGAALNYSVYTKNSYIVDGNNPSNLPAYEFTNLWANFPLQTGVVINKRTEVFATYTYPVAYTKYVDFSTNSRVFGVGVNLLFDKSKK